MRKLSVTFFVLTGIASLLLSGCSDKRMEADLAALKSEVAKLKAENQTAAKILRDEIAAGSQNSKNLIGEELAAARQDNEKLVTKIQDLSEEVAFAKRNLEDEKERLNRFIGTIPYVKLVDWNTKGKISCSELEISKTGSAGYVAATTEGLVVGGSNGILSAKGNCLAVQTIDGSYKAAIVVVKDSADIMVFTGDNGEARLSASNDNIGFVYHKDGDKRAVFLGASNGNPMLEMSGEDGRSSLYTSSGVRLNRMDGKPSISITGGKMRGDLRIYGEIGDEAKILIGLNDKNGDPLVILNGADKFGLIVPNLDKPEGK